MRENNVRRIEAAYNLRAIRKMREGATSLGIPGEYVGSLERYMADGLPPGGFMLAVLRNDLFCAVNRADDVSTLLLPQLVKLIYGYLDSALWGSEEHVDNWMYHDGYRGLHS